VRVAWPEPDPVGRAKTHLDISLPFSPGWMARIHHQSMRVYATSLSDPRIILGGGGALGQWVLVGVIVVPTGFLGS